MISGFNLYGANGDENGCEDQIYHDADPEIYHGHIKLIRTLGSVPQGKHETREEGRKVEPLKDDTQPVANIPKKIIGAKGGCENTED